MKKIALLLSATFVMILFLDSCSVQKRYHRKGFTVNWNNASVNMKKNRKVVHTESIQEDAIVTNNIEKQKLTRNYKTLVSMDIASTSVAVPTLTNTAPSIAAQTSVKSQAVTFAHTAKEISKEDAKSTKREAKAIIKAIKKEQKKQGSNTDPVLLVILAILVPFIGAPLAVYLYEGYWTERCTINLILSLLCGLPGIIHALIVILGNR
tara:strand:- start:310 stop:933 length:624 start_codon:yes stop_codon:yes gene_type:complete